MLYSDIQELRMYILPSVVGMRLSIEREAKKFPSEISLFVITARKQRKTQRDLLSIEVVSENHYHTGRQQ